jgi:hypothetical protein
MISIFINIIFLVINYQRIAGWCRSGAVTSLSLDRLQLISEFPLQDLGLIHVVRQHFLSVSGCPDLAKPVGRHSYRKVPAGASVQGWEHTNCKSQSLPPTVINEMRPTKIGSCYPNSTYHTSHPS